ncbi:hypothetical protein HZZ13_02410 [Bradyrhizobium sp. CNPSo 4010]|uniref:Uncharacterized protein n=1 Tax=Bradyrhizobium agreste TaxID=2751811 RepID=A0ABS0PHH1_9BRAD|nr:hypothetical protein [Bradyrhizobium agreste]MBH5396651.1 hypothetical protein [Bradyrhizobium agreste]
MKVGNIALPWRYDAMADCALQLAQLRRRATLRHLREAPPPDIIDIVMKGGFWPWLSI